MLTLNQVTLARGNKVLLEQATVSLFEKQKVGLIGNNGCGKSSLFSLLLGKITPDAGECQLNNHLRISHLAQHIPDSDESAIDYVLAGDEDYQLLQLKLTEAEKAGRDEEVLACHTLLEQSGGYSKPAAAAAILAGLGFKSKEQTATVNSFSGGWRMRLSLARCLMKPADLLLLDEPTNHLDMEAIFWLERWLKQSPATIVIISHDRDFLDAFVTHILHIEQRRATLYTGNYSTFEQNRAQQIALQQARFDKQQQKISHLMSYVNRFRAKASKAKQAQSRLKAIEKMDTIAKAQIDSPFSFDFFPCTNARGFLIRCNEVSAGYRKGQPVLDAINWTISSGDRIALLGPNGEGKSTLIKTLTGELQPLTGELERTPNLKIGYYAQHQIEQLDCNLSPVQTIQQLTPEASEQSIRDFLGGFNFAGDMALNPNQHFSGGEKARLVLATLVWQKPNLLLLDEPTNHLDLCMRSAIEMALQSYEGALIIISHDRHFLSTTVDDFYLVHNRSVKSFNGDVNDYYQWLKTNVSQDSNQTTPSKSGITHREKQQAKNKLKQLEQYVETVHKKVKELEYRLTDSSLYDSAKQKELNQIISERDRLEKEMQAGEAEWMNLAALLEKA